MACGWCWACEETRASLHRTTPSYRTTVTDMHYLANFFAGAFLCNCIPHLVCGLQGAPFPSPFAKPRGVGDSSPKVNFLWGFFNFLAGAYLLAICPVAIGIDTSLLLFLLGAFGLGLYLSIHFGKVRRHKYGG